MIGAITGTMLVAGQPKMLKMIVTAKTPVSRRSRRSHPKPSRRLVTNEGGSVAGLLCRIPMRITATAHGTNSATLTQKTLAMPNSASSKPLNTGPRMRVPLLVAALFVATV